MSEWTFRLVIAGVELTDTALDALFEAGCDDATFAKERDGSVLGLSTARLTRQRLRCCRPSSTSSRRGSTLASSGSPSRTTGSPPPRSRTVWGQARRAEAQAGKRSLENRVGSIGSAQFGARAALIGLGRGCAMACPPWNRPKRPVSVSRNRN